MDFCFCFVYTKKFIKRCRLKESPKREACITIAASMRCRRVIIAVIFVMMMTVTMIRTLICASVVVYFTLVRYIRVIHFRKEK